MFPVTLVTRSASAKADTANILGGTLDTIHVQVTGITGVGDQEEGARQLLASMRLDGTRVRRDGSTVPFITGVYADDFRQLANLRGGYLRALDGAFIPTNRQKFAPNEGLTIRATWDVPVVASVDFTAAVVTITRVAFDTNDGQEPLVVYEGKAVSATQDKLTTSVPNLAMIMLTGGTLESCKVAVGGSEHTLSAALLRSFTAVGFEWEQTTAPPLVLFQSQRGHAQPSLVLNSTSAVGRTIQIGADY